MSWTDDRTEQLKTLWLQGLSAAEIVKAIGGTTRSGVLGKAFRMGLKDEDRPERTGNGYHAKPPMPHHAIARRARRTSSEMPKAPELRIVRTEEMDDIPGEPTMPLLDLTSKCCRWPIGMPGTPGFGFCGKDKANTDSPYCAKHKARAYTAAKPLSVPRGIFLPAGKRSAA